MPSAHGFLLAFVYYEFLVHRKITLSILSAGSTEEGVAIESKCSEVKGGRCVAEGEHVGGEACMATSDCDVCCALDEHTERPNRP